MTNEELEKIVEPFCDNYCKYPRICEEQEELEEKCDKCPICKLAERIEKLEGKLSKYKSSESGAEKVRLMADIRSSEALKSVLTVIPEEQFLYSLADELVKKGWTRPIREGETLYTIAFGKVDKAEVISATHKLTVIARADDSELHIPDFKDGEGFYTDRKAAERELEVRKNE